MLRSGRHRLAPAIFNLPVEKMRDGYYSDTYFNRAREILDRDGFRPRVRMQVFQRNTSVLCGIDEAIAILKLCSGRRDGTAGATAGTSSTCTRSTTAIASRRSKPS